MSASGFRIGAAVVCLAAVTACGREPSAPPNIVLVVLDTVRADRLSCYGYHRPTSPRIDGLCARGIRFDRASSTSTWTLPAHASIFTGLYPVEHGATQENTNLGTGPATLAEILSDHGYATLGISANPIVSREAGMARGFDRFEETWREARRGRESGGDAHPNLDAAAKLLETVPEPFFLFVNFIEAHAPYTPPEPLRSSFLSDGATPELLQAAAAVSTPSFYLEPDAVTDETFAVLSDLYDGEIAHIDGLVGRLVEMLEASGQLERTVLVITSDHGENLGEHRHYRHVFSLYGTTVRVPLIIVLPDGEGAGQVRGEPVSLVDLFATLLARAGVESPSATGRDLLAEDAPGDTRPIFAEYYFPLQALEMFGAPALEDPRKPLAPYLRRLRSVEHGGMRLIWSSDGQHELFNRDRDPHERQDVAGQPWVAERERRLHGLLDDLVNRAGGPRPLPEAGATSGLSDVDPESAERLRELGYLR
jgi:arylsulfatase A-like enzyme